MSENDDEEIDPGYLRIAFNWPRMRAVQAHADLGSSFDPEELQSQLSEIEEDLGRFKKIRGQCTEIKKSRKSIEETLDDIEDDIKGRLGEIETELTKASSE
jgi:predicted transcriptional regulator